MKTGIYLIDANSFNLKLGAIKDLEILKKCDIVIYNCLECKEILSKLNENCLTVFVDVNDENNNINDLLVKSAKEKPLIAYLKRTDSKTFIDFTKEIDGIKINRIDFEVIRNKSINFMKIKSTFLLMNLKSTVTNRSSDTGLNVVKLPLGEINVVNQMDFETEILKIKHFEGIIFTSSVAIDIFFNTLYRLKKDSRQLCNLKIVAFGSSLANYLLNYGIIADIITEDYSKDNIVDTFKKIELAGGNFLIPESSQADHNWVNKLESYINPITVICYETNCDYTVTIDESYLETFDYLIFNSPFAVSYFIEILNRAKGDYLKILENKKIVAVGHQTKQSLLENKIDIELVINESTIEIMIDSILKSNLG